MGRADVYVQPDADDPVLSGRTVVELARAQVGRAEVVTGVDESGGEARVYLVDDDLVVKTQRPHRVRARTSLAKEAHVLRCLADEFAGYVPALFGYGKAETPEGNVEYLVMSRMPGRPALQVMPTGRAGIEMLLDLGRLLRRLHAQPARPLAETGLFPTDDERGALRRRLESSLADVVDEIAEQPSRWPLPISPDAVAVRLLEALPSRLDAPCLLHSNPGPTHAFLDSEGRLTGLIDFGDAYLSHPALDLHRWPAPSDRVTLCQGYMGREPPCGDFHLVWTIAMVYADMKALTGPVELAAEAREDLVRRLAEL